MPGHKGNMVPNPLYSDLNPNDARTEFPNPRAVSLAVHVRVP